MLPTNWQQSLVQACLFRILNGQLIKTKRREHFFHLTEKTFSFLHEGFCGDLCLQKTLEKRWLDFSLLKEHTLPFNCSIQLGPAPRDHSIFGRIKTGQFDFCTFQNWQPKIQTSTSPGQGPMCYTIKGRNENDHGELLNNKIVWQDKQDIVFILKSQKTNYMHIPASWFLKKIGYASQKSEKVSLCCVARAATLSKSACVPKSHTHTHHLNWHMRRREKITWTFHSPRKIIHSCFHLWWWGAHSTPPLISNLVPIAFLEPGQVKWLLFVHGWCL